MTQNNVYKYDNNNVFARILRDELPSKKVYEDEFAFAFHDIAEMAPIHVLVIPKGPYISLSHFTCYASESEIVGFWKAVEATAQKIGIPDIGYNLFTSIKETHGQEIFHFHIHLTSGKSLPDVLNDA